MIESFKSHANSSTYVRSSVMKLLMTLTRKEFELHTYTHKATPTLKLRDIELQNESFNSTNEQTSSFQ